MITSLARQSVVIKCNMQKSTMLGNYEFYYGAGLLDKLHGLGIDEEFLPSEEYDEQMKELLLWGKNEEFLWSINAS